MMRLLLSLILFLTALPTWAEDTDWVPIDTSGGLVKFPSSLKGVKGHSFFDSGTYMNGINEIFLAHNNLKLPRTGAKRRVSGLVNQETVPVYKPTKLNVFGSERTLRALRGLKFKDPDQQVMLGGAFLSHFILQIDYPNQRMRFLNRETSDLKKRAISSQSEHAIQKTRFTLEDVTSVEAPLWLKCA